MADFGKGKGRPNRGTSTSAAEKLDESDVLNLVLDYLATKGFTEAERTLRQSVSASGGSPSRSSNQQTGLSRNPHIPSLRCNCSRRHT